MPDTKPWPNGKRCALSLSFDDARPTQADYGFPVLDKHGYKATFYVCFRDLDARPDLWKAVHRNGHEIGNHTVSHPCSGKAEWSRQNAIEDYTLERIAKELDDATAKIESLFGEKPRTFAYPCGERHVGRDENRRSYEPLVNERFLYARGDGVLTSPVPVKVQGTDRVDLDRILQRLDEVRANGGWLMTVGHEIAPKDHPDQLTTDHEVLDALCRHLAERGDVWVAPMKEVAAYVKGA